MENLFESVEGLLQVLIPVVTVLVGVLYFASPKTAFAFVGLQAADKHPEAFGESRSTFAGFLIALGALAVFFKEPILYFVLAIAWGFVTFGKFVQIVFDDRKDKKTYLRLLLSAALSIGLLFFAQIPAFTFDLNLIQSDLISSVSAIITLIFGLLCLLCPAYSAALMRLSGNREIKGSVGELRGNVAGFYLATSLAVLLIGGTHVVLALGICWLITAFGRMISMLSDGTNNLFNWISLIVELTLAGLPILAVLGVF